MSLNPQTTISGNLADTPTLRFTPNGVAVANLTIIHNPRRFDRSAERWVDGEPVSLPATVWRDLAEHVAQTFTRGDRVLAAGRLETNAWSTDDGQRRSRLELQIDDIGPSLAYATARIAKAERQGARAATEPAAGSGDPAGEAPF